MAILEICANSLQSALNAQAGGAHRIELCQNLEAGGTTPSAGLITKVRRKLNIPVHVLIRPRTGDFVYSEDEIEVMVEDILVCRGLDCDGVVVGVLTEYGTVDVPRLRRLVEAARPMSVTFHRAFDDALHKFQALEDVVAAGCDRVLTSGGSKDVNQGMSTLAELVERANGRIVVMPGAGITVENLETLARKTRAVEFHASAKMTLEDARPSWFAAPQLQTDLGQVERLVEILESLSR